ncbi:MAG: hypothetical protein R3C61_08280 [Bacteroidia bacterium]
MSYDKYYNEAGQLIHDTGKGDQNYVIRTTQTTAQIYSDDPYNPRPGRESNPISVEKAAEVESEIKKGNVDNALVQDNVVALGTTSQMEQVMDIMAQDDGKGGDNQNITEYNATISDQGVVAEGKPGKPLKISNSGKAGIPQTSIKISKATNIVIHNHISGVAVSPNEKKATGPAVQGPSSRDISVAREKGVTGQVYGSRNKTIYVYDGSGVIATIPFKR